MHVSLEDAFMAVNQKMAAALRREVRDLEYTLPQLEVLHFVAEQEHPTMKDIAAHMRVTAPSATALIEYLYTRKLLIRKTDPNDRRGIRIYPTSKTLKLFSKFKKVKKTALGKVLSPLNSNDREQLTKILNKLIV